MYNYIRDSYFEIRFHEINKIHTIIVHEKKKKKQSIKYTSGLII